MSAWTARWSLGLLPSSLVLGPVIILSHMLPAMGHSLLTDAVWWCSSKTPQGISGSPSRRWWLRGRSSNTYQLQLCSCSRSFAVSHATWYGTRYAPNILYEVQYQRVDGLCCGAGSVELLGSVIFSCFVLPFPVASGSFSLCVR